MGVFSRADMTPTRHRYVGLCESVQMVIIFFDTLQCRVGSCENALLLLYDIFIYHRLFKSSIFAKYSIETTLILSSTGIENPNRLINLFVRTLCIIFFLYFNNNMDNIIILLRSNGYKLFHREV